MPKILFLSFIMLSLTCFAQDSNGVNELFGGKIGGGLSIPDDLNTIGGQLEVGFIATDDTKPYTHNVYFLGTLLPTHNLSPDDKALKLLSICYERGLNYRRRNKGPYFTPSLGLCIGFHSEIYTGNFTYLSGNGQTVYHTSSGIHLGFIFNPISYAFPLKKERRKIFIEAPIQGNLLYLKSMNLIYLFNLRLSMQFQ